MKILSVFLAAIIAASALSLHAYAENEPTVSAECAAVMNADTGGLILGKNAFKKHAMASTTKIMTALVTLEAGDPDKPFTVDSTAILVEGTSMGLRKGDVVTRRALCIGMLLPSGNDAANAAAVNVAGSLTAFADMMNKRAAEIGMTDTHFVNPSGLDAEGHYSTAYDMALLTAEALKNEDFRAICGLRSAKTEFGDPPEARTLYNSNKLLRMYDGCIGVKTGFTDNAGRCLVSAAERDGCTVIAVTLHAPDDWNDHKKLLDHGFSRLKAYKLRIASFSAEAVGGTSDTLTIQPSESVTVGLSEDEAARVTVRYNVPEFAYADINAGDILGHADIYIGDRLIRRVSMVSADSIPRIAAGRSLWDILCGWLSGKTAA